MFSFIKEQTFVVTGASSGIGAGVALLLNECGATVVAVARNEARLNEVKAKSQHPESFSIEIKDLSEDIQGLPSYVKTLRQKYGKLTGMACCAGIGINEPLMAIDLNTVTATFNINYLAPLFMAKGFCDRRNNIGRGSSFVAISSIGGIVCEKGQAAYAGSKAALAASLKCVAHEVTPQGVRINCVSPAMVETPMTAHADENSVIRQEDYPLGFAKVEDIANMIVFLLSDKAKWISGQNYVMDCARY